MGGGRLAECRDTGQGQQQKEVIEDKTITYKGTTNRRIFVGVGLQKIEACQGQQQKGVIEDNAVTDKGATSRRISSGGGLQKIATNVRGVETKGSQWRGYRK